MASTVQQPPDMDRLRWQCRRGMLELDEILRRYLEHGFCSSSTERQEQFRKLLEIEDPVLNEWLLLGRIPPEHELAGVARRVREA